MWYTLFNDLIASVQGDSSTSANIISGLFSRNSNVILEKKQKGMESNRMQHCQTQNQVHDM